MTIVDVAVLGPAFGFIVPPGIEERSGWDETWANRPVVSIPVTEEMTVGQILDLAADSFGIAVQLRPGERGSVPPSRVVAGVSFFRQPNEGRSKGTRHHPLVDDAGRVWWGLDIAGVTYEQLRVSAEQGIFEYDPCRIYLVPQESAGGPGDVDWESVLLAMSIVVNVLGGIDGVASGLERIGQGFTWLRGLFQRKRVDWEERGGGISDVTSTATSTTWSTEDVAKFLSIPPEDASTLLTLLGRKKAPDGRWVTANDDEHHQTRASLWLVLALMDSGLVWADDQQATIAACESALKRILSSHTEPEEVRAILFRVANPNYDSVDHGDWAPPF